MATLEETLFDVVIRCVPQWYVADDGPYPYQLQLDGHHSTFYSQRSLTPSLKSLHEWANSRLPAWKASLPKVPTPASITKISEELALRWLSSQAKTVEWERVLAYCDELRLQSHEPRWTPQIRPSMDSSKPATRRAPETGDVYPAATS
jgi:hypothetical protein